MSSRGGSTTIGDMETTHRILIAGATGVIGRRLVDSLSATGHEVHGLARSRTTTELIRSLGGAPVSGDPLDAGSVDRAVAHLRPTVVLHQATALKHVNPRKPRPTATPSAPSCTSSKAP
jgi:nucleoside-diphosphate-sugar epimerase